MGLNEAAGYGALGATALLTGYLAASYGLRPEPFYIGIVYGVLGLVLSVFLVQDTRDHARLEAVRHGPPRQSPHPPLAHVFAETSWRNRTLFSVSQAGLVNNLNDGMSWGVFPLLFVATGVSLPGVGLIKAVYPVVWGVGQIVTGLLADRLGRKPLIVWGMIVQAAGHAVIGLGLADPFAAGLAGSVLLGAGTAMVYPALLAAVGDVAHPAWRATSVGVYRFWRDLGYAVGALMAGVVAAMLGLVWAVHVAGMLTLLSGGLAWLGMRETLPALAANRADEPLPGALRSGRSCTPFQLETDEGADMEISPSPPLPRSSFPGGSHRSRAESRCRPREGHRRPR
jgi:MFS family permease